MLYSVLMLAPRPYQAHPFPIFTPVLQTGFS